MLQVPISSRIFLLVTVRPVDLSAYAITVTKTHDGFVGTVTDLPGCLPVGGRTRADLDAALQEAIFLYLDDHPNAPAHFLD